MSSELTIDNNAVVSIRDLNEVLTASKNRDGSELKLIFKNGIEKIDIAFIAGLILLSKKKHIRFGLECNIKSTGVPEIKQYLAQFTALYRTSWTDIFYRVTGIQSVGEWDYVPSGSFTPIMFIDKQTCRDFFENGDASSKVAVRLLSERYRIELLKNKKSNLEEIQYFKTSDSIADRLKSYPPIYAYVFSVLYKKINPFVNSRDKKISNPKERIEELWQFTEEYVKGLQELAKNIVEHSSDHVGMITIRAYDAEKDYEGTDIEKVLETHVFDYGNKGIISSLLAFTEQNEGKDPLYRSDLEILKSGFTIEDFMEPTQSKLLNQQLHREVAHYGLVRFNALIEKNEGTIICSSMRQDGKEREYYPRKGLLSEKSIELGTSYFFQLPFKPDLFKVQEVGNKVVMPQGTGGTTEGLARLLQFKIVDSKAIGPEVQEMQGEAMLDIKIEKTIADRAGEELAYVEVNDIIGTRQISYIALDMRGARLSDSSLLRILARLSNHLTQSIVVYNLDYNLYELMTKTCKVFYEVIGRGRSEIPFWNEDKGILFFTRINPNPRNLDFSINEKELVFNFADILYGKTQEEFEMINYMISHTFLNALSLISQPALIENYQIPPCLNQYFHQSGLLPFDVLLKNETGRTLFQSNLEVIVNQKLKMTPGRK